MALFFAIYLRFFLNSAAIEFFFGSGLFHLIGNFCPHPSQSILFDSIMTLFSVSHAGQFIFAFGAPITAIAAPVKPMNIPGIIRTMDAIIIPPSSKTSNPIIDITSLTGFPPEKYVVSTTIDSIFLFITNNHLFILFYSNFSLLHIFKIVKRIIDDLITKYFLPQYIKEGNILLKKFLEKLPIFDSKSILVLDGQKPRR